MTSPEDILRTLRAIADPNLKAEIVRRATPKIEAILRRNLERGVDAKGNAWEPRKSGGRAYANAAAKLAVKASGDLIYAIVESPEAYAHYETKHMPRRPMLPESSDVPREIANAIEDALSDILEGK